MLFISQRFLPNLFQTMTKVVNVMDKVAAKIENMDQLDKTASVMDTVTSSGSLTKDAKVSKTYTLV